MSIKNFLKKYVWKKLPKFEQVWIRESLATSIVFKYVDSCTQQSMIEIQRNQVPQFSINLRYSMNTKKPSTIQYCTYGLEKIMDLSTVSFDEQIYCRFCKFISALFGRIKRASLYPPNKAEVTKRQYPSKTHSCNVRGIGTFFLDT